MGAAQGRAGNRRKAAGVKLEAAAAKAGSEVERLARQRAAAGAAIDAAEARITAAEIELRARSQRLAQYRRSMALAQRPVSSLLAGLAMMGERPPILALADRGGVERLVRTRILLDSTIPYVRRRTAALEARVREGEQLETQAGTGAGGADRGPEPARRSAEALRGAGGQGRAGSNDGGRASACRRRPSAGRTRIARCREPVRIGRSSANGRRTAWRGTGRAGPAGTAQPEGCPLAYALPAEAPVTRGMAEIDRGGVRISRHHAWHPARRGAFGPRRRYHSLRRSVRRLMTGSSSSTMAMRLADPDRQRRDEAYSPAREFAAAIRSAAHLARSISNCPETGSESPRPSSQVHLRPCSKGADRG